MPFLLPLYRLSRALHRRGHRRAAAAVKVLNYVVHGADISPAAELGRVVVPHPAGVVIGEGASVGDGTYIMSGVVLGIRTLGAPGPAPRVGRACVLSAGAKLFGDIDVGDGAVIGANAVVLEPVPAGALAVGVPAKIVRDRARASLLGRNRGKTASQSPTPPREDDG